MVFSRPYPGRAGPALAGHLYFSRAAFFAWGMAASPQIASERVMPLQSKVEQKAEQLEDHLRQIAAGHHSVALANSLGIEDMLITHYILDRGIAIDIFSLDTGRLHQQTLQVIDDVRDRYGYQIAVYSPAAADVEAYVAEHGVNGFYRSVEQRKGCCHVRKVLPLQRALRGRDAWVTGMRRGQGQTRSELAEKTWDDNNGLWKYNPLADWREPEVWQVIREAEIPYNSLHDRHFASIGCAPCTRAITAGEEVRAGRWWWENPASRECGLHVAATPLDFTAGRNAGSERGGGEQD